MNSAGRNISSNRSDVWLKIKKGDQTELGKIFHQYYNELFYYGSKIFSDQEKVKDAIQNLFIVAGFDLSPKIIRYVKNGHLAFTIDQQPYMQGFYPVIQLVQYIRYGIVPSNNEIGASFVTKENVEKVEQLIKEGYR